MEFFFFFSQTEAVLVVFFVFGKKGEGLVLFFYAQESNDDTSDKVFVISRARVRACSCVWAYGEGAWPSFFFQGQVPRDWYYNAVGSRHG